MRHAWDEKQLREIKAMMEAMFEVIRHHARAIRELTEELKKQKE